MADLVLLQPPGSNHTEGPVGPPFSCSQSPSSHLLVGIRCCWDIFYSALPSSAKAACDLPVHNCPRCGLSRQMCLAFLSAASASAWSHVNIPMQTTRWHAPPQPLRRNCGQYSIELGSLGQSHCPSACTWQTAEGGLTSCTCWRSC